MSTDMTLTVTMYECDTCSEDRGEPVTELVRMMKTPAIFNGHVVGDEYWGCPMCLEPKFPVKKNGRKPPKPKAVTCEVPQPKRGPKLVVDNT